MPWEQDDVCGTTCEVRQRLEPGAVAQRRSVECGILTVDRKHIGEITRDGVIEITARQHRAFRTLCGT
jgi:hypothetical protein